MYRIIQTVFDTNKKRAIAEQVISTKFDKWSDAVFKACFYREQCASLYSMASKKDYVYGKIDEESGSITLIGLKNCCELEYYWQIWEEEKA